MLAYTQIPKNLRAGMYLILLISIYRGYMIICMRKLAGQYTINIPTCHILAHRGSSLNIREFAAMRYKLAMREIRSSHRKHFCH